MVKGRQTPAGGVSSILLARNAVLAVAETVAASFVRKLYDSKGNLVNFAIRCRGQHQGPGALCGRDAIEDGLPVPLGSQLESLYDVLRQKPSGPMTADVLALLHRNKLRAIWVLGAADALGDFCKNMS